MASEGLGAAPGALLDGSWAVLCGLGWLVAGSWAVLSGLGLLLSGPGSGLALTLHRRTSECTQTPYLFIEEVLIYV